jgi:hypothetical protein
MVSSGGIVDTVPESHYSDFHHISRFSTYGGVPKAADAIWVM